MLRVLDGMSGPLFENDAELPAPKRRILHSHIDSPARFLETSSNRKLSPVSVVQERGRRASLEPRAPFCCSTYASIEVTCPPCPFKESGCYAKSGYTGLINRRMDEAARGKTALAVAREEARLIDASFAGGGVPQDGARGGRDIRMHVGGDAGSGEAARILARAVRRFQKRGGGAAWTYTHAWRAVARSSWGSISSLASVELASDIEVARERGYASAIVVERFPRQHRAFSLPGSGARVIPCPAQTASVTCVECRLCLDDGRLLDRNLAIGFAVHGLGSSAVKRKLRVLNNIPETQLGLFSE